MSFRVLCLSTSALFLFCTCCPATETDEENAVLKQFVQEFVEITPGQEKFPAQFRFGKVGETVDVGESFRIAKYEMTQQVYQLVVGENPSRWKGLRNSVEMVTWDEAAACCKKLTRRLHDANLLPADREVRLPTERQWEYAAKAGTNTTFSFGNDMDELGKFAWFRGNAAGNDPPVGALAANPWGLYDMHGYIAEWCQKESEAAQQAPIRRGSWKSSAVDCRSESRILMDIDRADDAVGFRCVIIPKNRRSQKVCFHREST